MGTVCSSTATGPDRVLSTVEDLPRSMSNVSDRIRLENNVGSIPEPSGGETSPLRSTSVCKSEGPELISAASRQPSATHHRENNLPRTCEPEEIKLESLNNITESAAARVSGRLLREGRVASVDDKVLRVYHICHLTDTQEERDALFQREYPKLQLMCLKRGFDLDVIDLHWGQRDPFVMRGNLGIRSRDYVKSLLNMDKNTIFVVFLGEKYGMYGCPNIIPKDEMTKLLAALPEKDKTLIEECYRLDDNVRPSQFLLQPISSLVPNYGSPAKDEHSKACSNWSDLMATVGDVLWKYSSFEFRNKYLRSEFDEELQESVFTDTCSPENVILVKRHFTGGEMKDSPQFYDLRAGKPDETAKTLLTNLTNRLNDTVDPANKLDLDVRWKIRKPSGGGTSQASYLGNLCTKFKQVLWAVLERVMDAKCLHDRIRVSMVGAGMQKHLYDDILHHTIKCQSLYKDVIGCDDVLNGMINYIIDGHPTASSQHIRPLVVSGTTGSGKSTMASMLVHRSSAVRGWAKSVCVIRHIGTRPGPCSSDELIASIGAQLCFLFDLPYSYAHKPSSLYPGTLQNLLNRIPESTPVVIVLDGLDRLSDDNMAWLPGELPSHIRIVVTVTAGSRAHQILKVYLVFQHLMHRMIVTMETDLPWQREGYMIEIADFDDIDAEAMMNALLEENRRNLNPHQHELLRDSVHANPNPLFITLAVQLSLAWKSYTENDKVFIGNSIEELLRNGLLRVLQSCYGEEAVCRLLSYLCLVPGGVAESEMKDLLSCDEGFLLPVYMHTEPAVRRAPHYIWTDVRSYLQPFLENATFGGLQLTTWSHKVIRDIFKDICQSYEAVTWSKILDYYEGRWADGKEMPYPSQDDGIDHLRPRLVKPQPILYENQHNVRKLQQTGICLIQNNMIKKLKGEYLLNWTNLNLMLSAVGLYDTLLLMRLYLDIDGNDGDVQFMYDLLRQFASAAVQGSDHLWCQLFLRLDSEQLNTSEYPAVQKLLKELRQRSKPRHKAAVDTVSFLIPSTTDILNGQERTQVRPKPAIRALFTARGDANHLISVSPDKGKITVWNIHHQIAVRTLTNLHEPKDIKMIDDFRAVVLCSRELRVYNLNEGCEECRLKGVLNIKMPFFGVLDANHTVALSRNRMYVNIIKNSTGDTDATFKVGEDRFLDSLIVSANGKWCVCGDQVQKPFPLLVWDLVHRKLVHDLRLAGHEFLTRMAAITEEGHYVVSVCKMVEADIQYAPTPLKSCSIIERAVARAGRTKAKGLMDPNFLIVYDLQSGSLFKKWKPEFNTTSVQISSSSNVVISGHEDGCIHVWDLVGGALRHQLTGHSRGPDCISLSGDGERAATCDLSGRDTSVRLWDLIKGVSLGSFSCEYGVSCCQLSLDGSVTAIGVYGSDKIICLWSSPEDKEKSKMDISLYGDASRNKQTFSVDD